MCLKQRRDVGLVSEPFTALLFHYKAALRPQSCLEEAKGKKNRQSGERDIHQPDAFWGFQSWRLCRYTAQVVLSGSLS